MSLLKAALLRLVLSRMLFWDAPSSDMGIDTGEPEGTRGGGPDDRAADRGDKDGKTGKDGVDGQDDDPDAADEGDDDADASTRRAADEDDDDDQDDDPLDAVGSDDDDEGDTRPIDERFKKVVKAKRRLERTVKKHAPALARIKELGAAGLSLDDLVQSHRQLAALQRQIESDEGDTRGPRGGKKADREPTKYPFKLDNESGQFFRQFHEDHLAMKESLEREIADLKAQVSGITRERSTERAGATAKEWRAAADTAAKQIPDGFRDLFIHAIGHDMRRVLRGEFRATPQQVIEHHLGKLRKKGAIGKGTSSRASDAARESIARRNENQPRRPAGNGSPGPVKERTVSRMSDFNRKLRQKYGGGS